MAATTNIIIGFDVRNSCIKIMQAQGNALMKPTVEEIPFDSRLADNSDYVSIIDSLLSTYTNTAGLAQSNLTMLLPNNLVAMEYIAIPVMNKTKMAEALRTEFNGLYKNNADLQWVSYIITSNKRNATYSIAITNRPQLNAMQKKFTDLKSPVKTTTFAAAGTLNSVLHLRQKIRKNNFIFVDIREHETDFVICGREHLMGFSSLPFGYDILSRDEVFTESLLFDHDLAELAVLNATEMAKKKTLTVTDDEYEEQQSLEAEAIAAAEEEKARAAEEEQAAAKAKAEADAQTRKEALAREDLPPEEREVLEAEERAYQEEEAAKKKAAEEEAAQKAEDESYDDDEGGSQTSSAGQKRGGKVYAKRVPKRLPMFMQRPTPETEEGFILENFRIFEKRMLLCKRYCDFESLIPNPDFILINMPQEFEFVIDALNEDEDNKNVGCDFRYFAPQTEDSPIITDNLDLFGAMYAATYNKSLIF